MTTTQTVTHPLTGAEFQPQQIPDTDAITDHLVDVALEVDTDPETVALCLIAAAVEISAETIPPDLFAGFLLDVATALTVRQVS